MSIRQWFAETFGTCVVRIHGGYAVRRWTLIGYQFLDRDDLDYWWSGEYARKHAVVETEEAAFEMLANSGPDCGTPVRRDR